jgi:hypothetical protein
MKQQQTGYSNEDGWHRDVLLSVPWCTSGSRKLVEWNVDHKLQWRCERFSGVQGKQRLCHLVCTGSHCAIRSENVDNAEYKTHGKCPCAA